MTNSVEPDYMSCLIWIYTVCTSICFGLPGLTYCSRDTRKRVIGKQCRPRSDAAERGVWSGSPLFANSLGICRSHSRTYLKLKLDSSNILCGRVYSVYNGLKWVTVNANSSVGGNMIIKFFFCFFLRTLCSSYLNLFTGISDLNPFHPLPPDAHPIHTLYIGITSVWLCFQEKTKLFANSRDPDQMCHSAVSDLSPHCLPITLLGSPEGNGQV